jgi:type I restriction enzyme S subunit
MIHSSKKLNTLSSGTTISYLSRKQFEQFEIDIPSLDEQIKIANFLSVLDNKINYCIREINTSALESSELKEIFS